MLDNCDEIFTKDSQLFERVLAVDFHQDLPRDAPVSHENMQKRIKWHEPLQKLPASIPDLRSYHRSFFPLYMIECLQMLLSHKYKSMNYPTRVNLVTAKIAGSFAEVRFSSKEEIPFSHGDIVLLYVGSMGHDVVPDRDVVMQPAPLVGGMVDESTPYVSVPEDHPMYQDTLKHALAYVISAERKQCDLRLLILPPAFASIDTFDNRSLDRLEAMQNVLQLSTARDSGSIAVSDGLDSGEFWYVSKILSFSTALREFRALCMMKFMPLKDKLLTNYNSDADDEDAGDNVNKDHYLSKIKIPSKLRMSLEASFNTAQLRAIRNSVKEEGITLIQGPPGTGKTTTIMGIISALLESDECHDDILPDIMDLDEDVDGLYARNPWLKDNKFGDDVLDMSFDDLNSTDSNFDIHNHRYDSYGCIKQKGNVNSEVVRVPMKNHKNRRILICAPSNAAIDEIVKRLVRPVNGGIFNADGERYNPTVTRIGPNFHDDLKKYSLKHKVDRLIHLKYSAYNFKVESHIRSRLVHETLLNSDVVCSTLSACGSNELYAFMDMFDTLIVDEATQAVELSTLIALCLGCRRAILVGDPCQLSATVCSNVAVALNYDRSLFQRLQLCGYPVNLLNIQYRMDPRISRFPSMYFYRNQLKDAPSVYNRQVEDWREFPLLKPTIFYAIDSKQTKYETSYKNEMEANIVCQLLEIILEVLSAEPNFELSSLQQRIAIVTTYSAQVTLLKETIARRHKNLVIPQSEKDDTNPNATKIPKLLIDVSSVDGFQGMEKEIVIFSAVRTSYVGKRNIIKKSIREITPPSILTIDGEPHNPEDVEKFAKVSDDYLQGIRSGKISSDIQDIVDVSFIADRRRINVAITRALRNLFIVGNPRFLLDHTHWYSLYHHYAQCGYIFICNMNQSTLNDNYLKAWALTYLMKDPAACERFKQNPYLNKFVTSLVG
ncbi:hypothetical protein X943_001593 [Babesia divergens]|uniref:Uncharacterized protein n=1 Tax=Babesia divergens TaxID=32595 RepID=A0AAD9LE27_BABDI|nr:hypothetical protein X943_001593 [Babesia divergens]